MVMNTALQSEKNNQILQLLGSRKVTLPAQQHVLFRFAPWNDYSMITARLNATEIYISEYRGGMFPVQNSLTKQR